MARSLSVSEVLALHSITSSSVSPLRVDVARIMLRLQISVSRPEGSLSSELSTESQWKELKRILSLVS